MEFANYIIFHPDKMGKTEIRQKINVSAMALVNNKLQKNWNGSVFVDQINVGNEDPFVMVEPWLYSFCHASQLRRINHDNKVDVGSVIIFASGDFANNGELVVDTVFIVDRAYAWGKFNKEISRPSLPDSFADIYEQNCDLWNRHFKYPFEGQHSGVTHTYSARLWTEESPLFSFLPINDKGARVGFTLNSLDNNLSRKIMENVVGKFPVRLNNNEINQVLNKINEHTSIKVIRDIKLKEEMVTENLREKCSIC